MKYRVAFVCTGNSCRSQMAEGYAKHLGSEILEAHSAGTHPTDQVNPNAVLVMEEEGIDLKPHYPKLLGDIPDKIDILITMGCGVQCPFIPNKYMEDWGLEDPVGKPIGDFRKTRDTIKEKMMELIEKIKSGQIS